ncbi:MAG: hypothetical protein WCX88_01365 [Patescibacteria group bacterium]
MDKILIKKISKEVYQQKGFPLGPFNECPTCKCGENQQGGACCEDGADVDKEAYELILKHKDLLKSKLGFSIEECFKKDWLENDSEFLGGKGISTTIKNNTCPFQSPKDRCCELVKVVLENDLPRKMIPSTCRLYPLLWDNGELFVREIEKNCICAQKENNAKSIFETQKKDIEDIFYFE